MNKLQLTDDNIIHTLAPALLTSPKTADGYSESTILYNKELVNEGGDTVLKLTVARLKYIGSNLVTQAKNAAAAALGMIPDVPAKAFIILRSTLKLPGAAIDNPALHAIVGEALKIASVEYEMVEICNTTGIAGAPVATVNAEGVRLQRTTLIDDKPCRVFQECPIVPKGSKTHVVFPYNGPSLPLVSQSTIGSALAAALATAEATPLAPDAV